MLIQPPTDPQAAVLREIIETTRVFGHYGTFEEFQRHHGLTPECSLGVGVEQLTKHLLDIHFFLSRTKPLPSASREEIEYMSNLFAVNPVLQTLVGDGSDLARHMCTPIRIYRLDEVENDLAPYAERAMPANVVPLFPVSS